MRIDRLRLAEAEFLRAYPEAFASPELAAIGKRHRIQRRTEEARAALAEARFGRHSAVLEAIVKLVSRSSMVSLFEKPRFRDLVHGLSRDDRAWLAEGFRALLHGDAERGFNQVLDLLVAHQLGKWSLITIVPFYLRPETELFVKPTTTRNILRFLELEELVYRPRPSWAFYAGYRAAIDACKLQVDPRLSINNAAFTGFLMMVLQDAR
ncbi:MAG: hypothetical protein ACKOZX_05025 [Gammaproteobacteria bacterium]